MGAGASPLRDLLRLLRVRDWFHFLAMPLATFDVHAPLGGAVLAMGRGVASTFAILAFSYLLNSVADRHMDLDGRKNPLIFHTASYPRSALVLLLCASLGLVVFSPWPAQLAAAFSLTCFTVYSIGPRLKLFPIVGSVVNVGSFTPLLLLGMQDTSLPPNFAYVVLTFAGLLLQNQLIHEAADQAEDRAGGVRTTWLTFGPHWTALGAALSALGASVTAAYIVPGGPSLVVGAAAAAIFGAAFPLFLAWSGRQGENAAALRIAHRWCAALFGAALFAIGR